MTYAVDKDGLFVETNTIQKQMRERMASAIAKGQADTIGDALKMFTQSQMTALAQEGRLRWIRRIGDTHQTLLLDGRAVLVLHDPEFETVTEGDSIKLVATQRFQK